jgi:hypothetical protein
VHEQRAGERGDEPGDAERDELGPHEVHAVGLRGSLVVAHGDEQAPGATRLEPAHHQDRRRQRQQREVVVADLGVETDGAEQQRSLEAVVGQPVLEVRAEQP